MNVSPLSIVQKPINSERYTPSSEPFWMVRLFRISEVPFQISARRFATLIAGFVVAGLIP
jgi:hypothetical protein